MIIRIPLPPSASSAYAKKVMFMCANKVTLLTFSRLIWVRGKILKGRGLMPASASVPGVGCRMFWYHSGRGGVPRSLCRSADDGNELR